VAVFQQKDHLKNSIISQITYHTVCGLFQPKGWVGLGCSWCQLNWPSPINMDSMINEYCSG